jgi:hypothetical protein
VASEGLRKTGPGRYVSTTVVIGAFPRVDATGVHNP